MTDYATEGVDIQTAMVRHVQAQAGRPRQPPCILWNGLHVQTALYVTVPNTGRFRIEFLSPHREPLQGVDVKAEKGSALLSNGERVETLRTWHDPRYGRTVEYEFESKAGLVKVWNVYSVSRRAGELLEEKWTGNAGFWVEKAHEGSNILHCSPGPLPVPDFEQLVFRFTVLGDETRAGSPR